METFFDATILDLNHVQVIVRGMVAVAEGDGVHQSELVLLREFYDTCQREVGGLTDFDALIGQPFDASDAKDILNSDDLKEIFFSSCLLLAFADGVFSREERDIIGGLAKELGFGEHRLLVLEEQVKDHLMMQISKVENVDALKEIRSEMT